MVDREHLAGATEAGLHLVGDEQDAVCSAALDDPVDERRRRRDVAALAEHARTRGPDPAPRRTDELAAALDSIADNPLVRDRWPGEPYATAAAALSAAVTADDDAGRQVRSVLRPLLVAHLDDELAVTTPLIEAFRGRVPQR